MDSRKTDYRRLSIRAHLQDGPTGLFGTLVGRVWKASAGDGSEGWGDGGMIGVAAGQDIVN